MEVVSLSFWVWVCVLTCLSAACLPAFLCLEVRRQLAGVGAGAWVSQQSDSVLLCVLSQIVALGIFSGKQAWMLCGKIVHLVLLCLFTALDLLQIALLSCVWQKDLLTLATQPCFGIKSYHLSDFMVKFWCRCCGKHWWILAWLVGNFEQCPQVNRAGAEFLAQ